MDLIAVIGRFVLAAVFVVAGVSKLLDRDGSRTALEGFGVPAPLVPAGSILLPVAELLVAAALVIPATLTAGAAGAAGLLGLFVVGIGTNMALGRQPDCHCFGQLHSAPAGWSTLVRNSILGALAGVVLWRGSAATLGDLGDAVTGVAAAGPVAIGLVLVAILAVAQTFFIYGLLRQNGRILLRLDELESGSVENEAAPEPAGLPVGTAAPAFALAGLHGETMTLDALRAQGKPTVLLFTDPDCQPCNELMPDIAAWQRDASDRATIVVVSRRSAEANARKSKEHGLSNLLLQKDTEVADAYRYKGTPSAVVVGTDGKIATALAPGAPAVRRLIATTVGREPSVNGAARPAPVRKSSSVGQVAPSFTLPDLSGAQFASEELRGRETLVLFWNPSCGFCKKMLDDLRTWEVERPGTSPELLLISQGGVEENQAMGLRSKILLDQGFEIASRFGVSGTPIAVLVDEAGRIASVPAIGAQAVLTLAGRPSDAASA